MSKDKREGRQSIMAFCVKLKRGGGEEVEINEKLKRNTQSAGNDSNNDTQNQN